MWPFSSLLFTFLLFVVWWALKNVLFQWFWLNNLSNFSHLRLNYISVSSLCANITEHACNKNWLSSPDRFIYLSIVDHCEIGNATEKTSARHVVRGVGRGKARSFGKLLKCTWSIEGIREIRKVINIEFVWETWHMQRDQRWVVVYILNIWKEQT